MKITFLGTGAAMVSEIFNTCYFIQDKESNLLVDAGGGHGILHQLKKAKISVSDISNILITHYHSDHLLGIAGIVRVLKKINEKAMKKKTINVYCSKKVQSCIEILFKDVICSHQELLQNFIRFIRISHNTTMSIGSWKVTFFDVFSPKHEQHGIVINAKQKIVCSGDEPLREKNFAIAKNPDVLIHDAFCLEAEKEQHKPHDKRHSTVKDGAQTAKAINAKKLVLLHTVDDNIAKRKELFTKEARQYFDGKIIVPDDLEVLEV